MSAVALHARGHGSLEGKQHCIQPEARSRFLAWGKWQRCRRRITALHTTGHHSDYYDSAWNCAKLLRSQACSGMSICPSSLFRLRRIQPSAQVAARLNKRYCLLSSAEMMTLHARLSSACSGFPRCASLSVPGTAGSASTHRVCSVLLLPGAVSALADDTDGKPFAANACPAPSCLL
jgi:hypothetical protein